MSSIALRLTALLESTQSGNRIRAIEGMRGYAVLLVFLVHHHAVFGAYLRPEGWAYKTSQLLQDIGHSGVDIFFLVSGFLIYSQLMSRQIPYARFIIKRIQRIYPTFLAVFAMYTLICLLIPSVSKLPTTAPSMALYLTKNILLLPGIVDIEPLITVAWSLSYEFLFYLCLPILVSVTRMRKWFPATRILFFLLLFIFHCVTYELGWLPHIRLSMFIAGILLYELMHSAWFPRMTPTSEILVALLYISGMLLVSLLDLSEGRFTLRPHQPNVQFVWWTGVLFLILPVFTIHCFTHEGILKRFFNASAMRGVGNISYSFFLLHGLVLNAIAFLLKPHLLQGGVPPWLFALIMIANLLLALVASFALFIFIEKPLSFTHPTGRARTRSAPQTGPSGVTYGL